MRKVWERYSKTAEGEYIIHTRAESCHSLYRRFDFESSFPKRDLDPDFAAFLHECLTELGSNPFVLQIDLPEKEREQDYPARIRESIKTYFEYLNELARKDRRDIVGRILLNFFLAIALLVVVIFVERFIPNRESVFSKIFSQGLYIAVWVLMWPVFSEFLYNFRQIGKEMKINERISKAGIRISYY